MLLLDKPESTLPVQVLQGTTRVTAGGVLNVLLLRVLLHVVGGDLRGSVIVRVGPGDGIRIFWGNLAIGHCCSQEIQCQTEEEGPLLTSKAQGTSESGG